MNYDMDEETARDTISRMFREMSNVLNGVGDVSLSESEGDSDVNPEQQLPAASVAPATIGQEQDAPKKKKSKKKKKKKSKASKPEIGDPLDMEDSPNPEEVDLYDLSCSIEERIELAVTKFRRNRRFNPTRSQILSTYLGYGGIKSGPKSYQGGGLSSHGDDGSGGPGEPDYDMVRAGIDLVEEPKEHQVVDFTNVAATFLSEYFLYHTGWIAHDYYVETPKVIASLLNYFLLRNVVPEYKDDIAQALEITKQAGIELPIIRDVSRAMPGMFSKSCSLLLEGSLHDVAGDEDPWQGASVAGNTFGTDVDVSRRILQAVLGPDQDMSKFTVVSRGFMELELIAVYLPKETTPLTNASTIASGPVEIGEGEDIANNPQLETLLDQTLQEQGQQHAQHLRTHDQHETSGHEANDPITTGSGANNTSGTTGTTDNTDTTTGTIHANWEDAENNGVVLENTNGPTNDATTDHLVPLEDAWPIPVFARLEFAEWDSDLLRENQKPLAERRHLSTYLEVPIAEKLLLGMRVEAKVFKLSVGNLCYLEQASFRPTYYLAADVEEGDDEVYGDTWGF